VVTNFGKNGKDIVNEVKRREWFRPFAGTVLAENASEWFDLRSKTDTPYMMYAVDVLEDKRDIIPAISHVDGTCRIQTVKQEQNPLFYELISEFYKLSGVPILFNTSFNLGGEPMVETLNDAIHTLVNSDIEYLYLPEYNILITAENQSKEV
jgi:carbamoyltransferase